ncbi:DUF397 domain-containing protein [Streptomyces sp. TRM66268-LWL]|uniref:DUF397 domain-containing protein n=1 Tax=Streptomyces polyasparticus TaxID=2767826 RepID=A0ABR7SN92_9ACTN|nr:DUF397 domain-containing protein [Streptomyces polyasparticus]MBC9716947.1 DUF397 domain-containing protein [Streptomyces polyasparticus]
MTSTLRWFKSSYSSEQGGDCLEVAYDWRKSTYSDDVHDRCVEVAPHPAAIHIRDSKCPEGDILTVTPEAWAKFTAYATA